MESPTSVERGAGTVLAGLGRTVRPSQWYKQSLLFVALVFSGNLFEPTHAWQVIVGAAAFSAAAGGVYVFNDIRDREADRRHPRKRTRPIASGQVPVAVAAPFGAVLLGLAAALGVSVNQSFLAVLVLYLLQNGLYTLWLKRVAFIDVVIVAVGFLLRAVAGVVAIGAVLSPWLIISTFLLALLLALAKRHHELSAADETTREVLNVYSRPLLEQLMTLVGTSLAVSYTLYTVVGSTLLSTVTLPFVYLGLFRFFYFVHDADRRPLPLPLLRDRQFALYLSGWVAAVLVVVYVVPGSVPL